MKLILLIKAFVYRMYSSVITALITYGLTGNLSLSILLGGIDVFVKILSYFFFDLLWNKLVYNYKPCVIWMTGLSGSGKTTIARGIYKKLTKRGAKCILLDGDEIRNIVPAPIGFSQKERIQHNINIGYMASLFEKQGYIVVVSMISPFKESREKCRKLCTRFIETYINTPLIICENRDVKGLYQKARLGEIQEFTGISSAYEPPENPELNIETVHHSVTENIKKIINFL